MIEGMQDIAESDANGDETGMLVFGRGEVGVTLAAHEGKGAMVLMKCKARPIGQIEEIDFEKEGGPSVVLAFEDVPAIERMIGNLDQLKAFVLSGESGSKPPQDVLCTHKPDSFTETAR